jgi:hypothetical protein
MKSAAQLIFIADLISAVFGAILQLHHRRRTAIDPWISSDQCQECIMFCD